MSHSITSRTFTLRVTLAGFLTCVGCHKKLAPAPAGSTLEARSATKPVDRLAPDELAAGTGEIWGLTIPRDMHIEYHFPEIASVVGPVKPDALANYVRDRVVVSHVEIGAGRSIFPNARIKGGPAGHLYELDVIPAPGGSRLEIQDLTPVKVTPGLTDAERWKQAGLTPQGRPLDMKKFE